MMPIIVLNKKKTIPCNSMELGVRQFRLHEQFHGIPWNSMELEVRQFRWHEQFHRIPWNSEELEMRQFRWHERFHGIPWNMGCANFDDPSSSMQFRGTSSASISMAPAVPLNAMELVVRQFRWRAVPWDSMQLGVRQFRWNEQVRGIPWNSLELGVR